MTNRSPNICPVVLIIRDGWGHNPHPEQDRFNAIRLANTPVDSRLTAEWPHTLLRTCGEDVGLPEHTMGNSEVGHQNIGAGRIVDQETMRITRAIRSGDFFDNKALLGAIEHAKKHDTDLHLMGLLSDGNVHSSIEHLFALIDLAARHDMPGERVFIHAFMDGRDTGPRTGLGFMQQLQRKLADTGIGRVATVIGRYYAMDRDNRWDRIARAYQCLTGRDVAHPNLDSIAAHAAHTAEQAIQQYYDEPTEENRAGDEFIVPTNIVDDLGHPIGIIQDRDAVIFFNFRGDRPRQITRAFVLPDAQWKNVARGGFDRGRRIDDLYYCTMTNYEKDLEVTAVAFEKPPKMKNILGQVIAEADLTQFRCAETEKFAHVTFFFNDYREEPFEGEHRALIDSPTDVTTYDQKPEMSAERVRDAVLERIAAEDCESLIIVNFANPDMVGHTGRLEAVVKAVETVDACVGDIVDATLERGGAVLVTADHGNAEQMWNPDTDAPHTAHTTYDVPAILIGKPYRDVTLRDGGRLANIAPTLLDVLGLPRPDEMTGTSLISAVPADASPAADDASANAARVSR